MPAPAGLLCHESTGDEVFITYAELLAAARRILAALQAEGVQRGTPVVFHLRRNRDFFEAFWACVLGGFVPVPTPPAPGYTELNGNVQRLGDACALLESGHGAALILTEAALQDDLRIAAQLLGVAPWRSLAVETLRRCAAEPQIVAAAGDDIALMMLTSGSTGRPKGVPQPHRNLLARSFGSCQRNGFDAGMVSVNWMPLDHVAGLIYFHLRDVHLACRQVHLATDLVLRDPLLWLDAVHRERARVTFAPNFAFGLVVGLAERVAGQHWDLSCLREVLNGGEAIVAASARSFLKLLMPHGLAGDAMVPAWGMSETSSGVTYSRGFRLDSTADADAHVQVGHPLPGVKLRIVDEGNRLLREGQVGQLQITGATVFDGYFAGAQPRDETFSADGWFRTGDLGRLDGGNLSITGREKDVIIINGANYAGAAIENAVDELAGVERSFTAACAVNDPQAGGREALAVFFVPGSGVALLDDALAELLRAVRQCIVRAFGISPAFVVPLVRADIPKTSIGKIQRGALQKGLVGGRFEDALRRVDRLLRNANTLSPWFFRRRWQAKALPTAEGAAPRVEGSWLLLAPPGAWADALATALHNAGNAVVMAGPDADAWPGAAAAAKTLVIAIERRDDGAPLQRLIGHAARLAEWLRRLPAGEARLLVALHGEVSAATGADVDAAVAATMNSLAQERAGLHATFVDLGGLAPIAAAQALCAERAAPAAEREIAYRPTAAPGGAQRCVPVLVCETPQPVATGGVLRRGGRYVISGASGGVGAVLAAWLLREFEARLLLVGRDAAALATLQASLRELSPQVEVALADVTDGASLAGAVRPKLQAWPDAPDAVFHLAGSYHEAAWADETALSLHAGLAPKLGGALALLELLHDRPRTALVLFSSITSLFGGAMVGAYALANRALDAMAADADGGRPIYSLAWSAWRDTGLNRRFGASEPLRAMGVTELGREQALTSLRIVLSQPPGAWAIGLDPGHAFVQRHGATVRLDQQVQGIVESAGDESLPASDTVRDRFGSACVLQWRALAQLPSDATGAIDRDALHHQVLHRQSFRAPAGATQRRLAALWSRLLGIGHISTDASFFELGGQSLLATQLLSAIDQQFGVRWSLRDIFDAPTIAAQAVRLDSGATPAGMPLPVTVSAGTDEGAERRLPLASAQQRLWFLDRIHPHNTAFHIPAALRFATAPDPLRVRRCLQALSDRHDSLRTRFPEADGQPCQLIAPPQPIELAVQPLSAADDAAAIELAEALAPFDLARGPLWRARLLLLADGRAVLLMTLHHIIGDGWSMRVLFEQFQHFWRAEGRDTLPPPACQFTDFAAWQRRMLEGAATRAQVERWRERLAGNLHGFSLPTDLPRPAVQTYRGARHSALLGSALTQRLRALVVERGSTLFVLLLSAFKALLARYAQHTDIVVGTVFANRNRTEFEELIGFVVNVLALRTDLGGDPRFADLVQRVQRVVLDAHADHELPFETLVERLAPPRDTSRSPLFQIAFDLRDAKIVDSSVEGLAPSVMEPDLGACQFDLHLTFEERPDQLIGHWQYNTDLFEAATVQRMAANLEALLDAVSVQPGLRLSALPLPAAAEIALLEAWNRSAAPFFDGAFHRLFEQHVDRTPGAAALIHHEQVLSYRALDARANRWAHELRALSIGVGDVVGVMTERSIETVVAILAILKAGAAYLPLDADYPAERLRFMLADSKVGWVATQQRLAPRLADLGAARALVLDDARVAQHPATAPDVRVAADDLAYLIYTSGSTGRPKGVQVAHRGWCNVAQAEHDVLGMRPGLRVLQFASLSFDASAFELAMALGNGGTLVIGDAHEVMPGAALARLLREQQVQVITVPPSSLALLDGEFAHLRIVNVAGEACPGAVVARWARAPLRLFNLYGPTEATIWASFAECHAPQTDATEEAGAGEVPPPPIGRPVPNVELHVLDAQGMPLPIGMPGELYIGGVGVARGYLDRAEQNAHRFVPDPFSGRPGARLYRSGDLVRRNGAGELEFLGRVDHQVKLRGFRIELGEIDAVLRGHAAVQESIVVAQALGAGDSSLVAYASPAAGKPLPTVAELRQHLARALPAHMVPAHIVVLPTLPMTANGKVDRAALPDPLQLPRSGANEAALPHGAIEQLIADTWQQVLERPVLDRQINFFEAGGHSLKLARVHSLLAERVPRPPSLVDLFQYPTIASLAAHLAGPTDEPAASAPPTAAPMPGKPAGADAQRMAALARLQRAARDGTR